MSTAARKQAPRPARPVGRYWKGKAPKGAADLPSSDEEDEEDPQELEEEGDVALSGDQDFLAGAAGEDEEDEGDAGKGRKVGKMSIALRDVNISKDGKVIVAGREEVGRTAAEEESSDEEEEEEEGAKAKGGDDSDEESSEYETDSEDEKPKVQFRPVFVPKRGRVTVAEREAEAQDTEEALRKKEAEAEERKRQSHDMVADSIRRELAEKVKEDEAPDVDDTDGLDPEGEFEAWRLRELARIKRDKEAEVARDLEREEIERRRALPEEQRLKEDLERANKLREEKPKGQQVFLQKYWHKGAFHQDEEILRRHDFTEKTESTVDVSSLPAVMQVKNFGKRGRTKYTHLVDQDTTVGTGGFGGAGPVKAGGKGTDGGGCFLCGGPHMKKDCPQNTGSIPGRPGTGANAAATGFRDDRKGSWRERDDGYAPRDRGRSRSQSPPRRDDRHDRDRDRGYSNRRGGGERYVDRKESGGRDRSARRDGRGDDRDRRWRERGRSRSRTLSREREGKRRRSSSHSPTNVAPARTVKVAVIGSGLAGLTTAYLLSTLRTRTDVAFADGERVDFEVHLFEKASELGMDSHSISLTLPGAPQAEWRVDVPMRSFQGGYYPQLIALYTHLGVAFRPTDFSYSFTTLPTLPAPQTKLSIRPEILYGGASAMRGLSMPSTWLTQATCAKSWLAQMLALVRAHVDHAATSLSMLALFLRLLGLSAPILRPAAIADMTWAEWTTRYTPQGPLARWLGCDARWRAFVDDICEPLFSAVCTASREDVANHPAEEFLDFCWRTFLTHHYVVSNGVRDVVARLSTHIPAPHIHLGAPATSLVPDAHSPGLVSIVCTPPDPDATNTLSIHNGFSHVILATQANWAAPLLRGYAATLRTQSQDESAAADADALGACLENVAYRDTVVINHTDASFLPSDVHDRRDLNLVTVAPACPSSSEKTAQDTHSKLVVPESYTMTTHRLPRPTHAPRVADGPSDEDAIFQTTNPVVAPTSGSVLSVSRLERALLTVEGKRAVKMLCRPYGPGVGVLQGAAVRARGRGKAAGVWVVGSYTAKGIPLLEGCVESARDVVVGEGGILNCEGGVVGGSLW
ncbi:splicing factor, Prp19-binding domain-containing protein [Amylostereum chailletii]|nr:splicing factor, Prp19-binding domain-containing protein [Amylostereum chailletii]